LTVKLHFWATLHAARKPTITKIKRIKK